MMNLQNTGVSVAIALLFLCTPARAEQCGPTPPQFQGFQFGSTLFSLLAPCERTFSHKEQVFVAGMTHTLVAKCGPPSDPESISLLQKFLTSSTLVGAIGSQYANPDLGEGVGDQVSSMTAYALGEGVANDIGCDDQTDELVIERVVNYLERTAGQGTGGSAYVAGCARYYAGQYSAQQCQCLADIGRSVDPGIHQRAFSRDSIYSIIQANPFVGLQVAIQCGFGDY